MQKQLRVVQSTSIGYIHPTDQISEAKRIGSLFVLSILLIPIFLLVLKIGTSLQKLVLPIVFCNLLPNHCCLDSHKRNKIYVRLMPIALFSPPLIN